MDTISAFSRSMENRGKETMVFDWHKAATQIKESGAKNAKAGLGGDWEWTGGDILVDGKIPEYTYTYLASTWATPELDLGGDIIECYKYESKTDGWGAKTFWPQSAKDILGI